MARLPVYTRAGVDTLIAGVKALLTTHQNNSTNAHGINLLSDKIAANTTSIAVNSAALLLSQRGALTQADDFSEADGTAIVGKAPDTGAGTWASALGAPTVKTGYAVVTSGSGQNIAYLTASHNLVVRVTGQCPTVNDTYGVYFGKNDNGTRYYYVVRNGGSELRIQWYDGSALQLLTTVGAVNPVGRDEVMTVIRQGGRIVVRLDGVQVLDYAVTDYSANTSHQVGINIVNGGKINDFKAWPIEVV